MVLGELAKKLQEALENMRKQPYVNKEVIDELLRDITNTLMDSDIAFPLVKRMRMNLEKKLDVELMSNGVNRRMIIQRAVHEELISLLDPGVEPF